jgi:hypothetical protein
MRDVLASCRKDPCQKFKAIEDFSRDLFSSPALRDWGVEIDEDPMEIVSKILPPPVMILGNGKKMEIGPDTLRNLPIQFPTG